MQRLRMEVSGGRAQLALEVGVLAKDKQEEHVYHDDDDDDEEDEEAAGPGQAGRHGTNPADLSTSFSYFTVILHIL